MMLKCHTLQGPTAVLSVPLYRLQSNIINIVICSRSRAAVQNSVSVFGFLRNAVTVTLRWLQSCEDDAFIQNNKINRVEFRVAPPKIRIVVNMKSVWIDIRENKSLYDFFAGNLNSARISVVLNLNGLGL